MFTDIVNEPVDAEAKSTTFPAPSDHWINRPIPEENEKTLLMVAIDLQLRDFVEVLLQAGADANLYNAELGQHPIHSAAQVRNAAVLEALLVGHESNRADVNARMKNGRTALHIVTEAENEDCFQLLINRPKLEVDVKDKKGAQTPLYFAAKKGNCGMAKALIERGADCGNKCFRKTISELLSETIPDLDIGSVKRKTAPLEKQGSATAFEAAADTIQSCRARGHERDEDVRRLRSLAAEMGSDAVNERDVGGYTLLQLAVDGQLAGAVGVLLEEAGADPNGTTEKVPIAPVNFAAERADAAILGLLLKRKANVCLSRSSQSGETVLHSLLKHGEDGERRACLDLLLNDDGAKGDVRKIINKRDCLEFTPLHYAVQLWSQDVVRLLLEAGANIGMKNHWQDIPISKISAQTMEDFLDEFCIAAEGDVNHEDFEVTYDYSFLAPPPEDLGSDNLEALNRVDPEVQKLNSKDGGHKAALPETDSLWYMGQSKEHRHLLKHPVVTSFLYLKWGRIRQYFNRNLRFYILFVYLLTWYIFELFGGKSIRSGTEGVDEKQTTLPFFHVMFGILSAFLLLFVVRDWIMDIKEKMKIERFEEARIEPRSGKVFCQVLLSNWVEAVFIAFLFVVLVCGKSIDVVQGGLVILTGILIVREFFQMTVSLKRYLLSPENWLEVSVIVLIMVVIYGEDGSQDLKRHLSAIAIVFSWAELITLVGKHPKLTRYNVYVVMFYKVMGTFFFFLCWYAFFIIAFGLGFYIMLHKDSPTDEPPTEDDYIFFNSPWLALVKTSTMFVGELEFGDIPIDKDTTLTPLSYLFFLAFVFLIVVVLMNLLNGLAVSDTGIIQEKAEIVSYMSRVDTISYTESILLGDPFNFLSNWPVLKWLRDLPSCSICPHLYKNRSIQKLFNRITGATGILLFYNILPTKKMTFKPNSKRQNCNLCQV